MSLGKQCVQANMVGESSEWTAHVRWIYIYIYINILVPRDIGTASKHIVEHHLRLGFYNKLTIQIYNSSNSGAGAGADADDADADLDDADGGVRWRKNIRTNLPTNRLSDCGVRSAWACFAARRRFFFVFLFRYGEDARACSNVSIFVYLLTLNPLANGWIF